MLTLAEAARLAGVSKTTLMRAIRAGRLSATPLDDGGYSIDERQFARVYKVKLESPAIGGGAPRKIGRVEARAIVAVSPIALSDPPATPADPPVFAVAPAPSADLTPAQVVWPSPPNPNVDTLETPASSPSPADR
jgi:excisionase family DNA binding protein